MTLSGKDKQGIVIITSVVIIFAGMFTWVYCLKAAADSIDPDTLCRIGKQDPVVKLLIDKTDPWDKHTRQRLGTIIRRIKNSLNRYERLSIFVLDATGTYSPSPRFDMCNPGRGNQANKLTENDRRVQQKFEAQFAAPLDALLTSLMTPGTAPSSPIVETIHGLRGDNPREKLIIVSDMMQNSEELSFYGAAPGLSQAHAEEICRMESPYQSVQVLYINRPGIKVARKQQIRNFWNHCFAKAANTTGWSVL